VSNSAANGDAAAVIEGRVRDKYASKECNVYLSKHSAAKCLILYIIVLT
jgi:hypothetical protein